MRTTFHAELLEKLKAQAAIRRKQDPEQLKHALNEVAAECGFPHWTALKQAVDRWFEQGLEDRIYPPWADAFLNHWESDYAKALAAQGEGYLFPYRRHYFVTTATFVESLGLDPGDPDWERLGRNFAEPRDVLAWTRLARRLWASEPEREPERGQFGAGPVAQAPER